MFIVAMFKKTVLILCNEVTAWTVIFSINHMIFKDVLIGELQSKTILPTSYLANPASYLQRSSLNLYALNMK